MDLSEDKNMQGDKNKVRRIDANPQMSNNNNITNNYGNHAANNDGNGGAYNYDGAVIDEEEWEPSGEEKEYLPVAEDVGCVLKVKASILFCPSLRIYFSL